MVLIAGDFTYLYALWDNFFTYIAAAVLSYGCGLAHGIAGMLLLRYFQKKQNKPTNSDQDNDAPANAHAPGNELEPRQANPPPMPRTDYIYQTIPSDISVGLGESCYRYHNTNSPCSTFLKYKKAPHNKTKWLTPCKHCYPEFYSR